LFPPIEKESRCWLLEVRLTLMIVATCRLGVSLFQGFKEVGTKIAPSKLQYSDRCQTLSETLQVDSRDQKETVDESSIVWVSGCMMRFLPYNGAKNNIILSPVLLATGKVLAPQHEEHRIATANAGITPQRRQSAKIAAETGSTVQQRSCAAAHWRNCNLTTAQRGSSAPAQMKSNNSGAAQRRSAAHAT